MKKHLLSFPEKVGKILRDYDRVCLCPYAGEQLVAYDQLTKEIVIATITGDIKKRISLRPDFVSDERRRNHSRNNNWKRFSCSMDVSRSGKIIVYDGELDELWLLGADFSVQPFPLKDLPEEVRSVNFLPDDAILIESDWKNHLLHKFTENGSLLESFVDVETTVDRVDSPLSTGRRCTVLSNGDIICLRNVDTELIDTLTADFRLKHRFMGLQRWYQAGWFSQQVQTKASHQISIQVSFPSSEINDYVLIGSRNGSEIVIVVNRDSERYIESHSGDFRSFSVRQFKHDHAVCALVNVSEKLWIFADITGHIFSLQDQDLHFVDLSAYRETLDTRYLLAASRPKHICLLEKGRQMERHVTFHGRDVPPMISAKAIANLRKMATIIPSELLIAAPVIISETGDSDLSRLIAELGRQRLSEGILITVTQAIGSLTFNPMIVDGNPKSCRCSLTLHFAPLEINFLKSFPIVTQLQ